MIVPEGDTALDRLIYLEGVREVQLKAAQTGDGAIHVLLVIAPLVYILAVIAIKKKRKI